MYFRPHYSNKSPALRTDVTADFQRLNVLLLRAVTGKMIGTALLTEARIHVKLSEAICATGSLGGLQVHSLLPGSQLHQRIISVGKDPTAEDTKKIRQPNIHSELYVDPKAFQSMDQELRAFSFVINYITSGKYISGFGFFFVIEDSERALFIQGLFCYIFPFL